MYKIKIDDTLVYDPRLPDYRIQEALLKQQINKAGSFTMTLPLGHPRRTLAQRLKSTILVQQDNATIFRGRALNEKNSFYGSRQLTCEGQLAFFNDSIVRPYEYKGSIEGYVQLLIDSHNAQVPADRQFALGNVTVTDPNDYISRASDQYPTTWAEINDKLLNLLGGYIIPRIIENTVYIDYLDDISTKNLQDVEFGKNLLDLSQVIKGQDIATVIIPLGARQEDGTRVTIASVNDGKDYVENTEAIAMYGRITKIVHHDDVTSPSNLLRKGSEDLQQSALQAETINVSAADLSSAGYDIQSFRFGQYERVISSPHVLSALMLVSQLTTDILHPEKSKLTLGRTRKTFTAEQMELQGQQKRENLGIFETADDAKKLAQSANNINIGGRNLFLKTGDEVSNNEYRVQGYMPANGPLVPGETYTVTICVTPAQNVTAYGLHFSGGYAFAAALNVVGTSKQIISSIFEMPQYYPGRTPDDSAVYACAEFYRFPDDSSVISNSTIHWVKIEKGNKATDWTPAPEDFDEKIENVYTEINNTYTNATKTANEIILEAVKEYVKTSDLETFKQQISTQFVQSAESVDILFNRVVEQVKQLEGDTTNEFVIWRKYIRFIDGSIVLGQEENPLILTLVNDEIRFTNNGVKVAWFSHNQMHVANLVITELANLCGLKITKSGRHIRIG